MPAVKNTVGQLFVPAKQGGPSANLATQNVVNSGVQPNNCYLLAGLASNVTLTSGPPLAYTGLPWDLISDSIKLGYPGSFTTITLYGGVWDVQLFITFGDTSDGQAMRITANLPTNLTGTPATQFTPENVSLLFNQRIAVQDPTITKMLPYTLNEIGLYYESRNWGTGATNPGATVSTIGGQLLISRVG
jgi:hypothetical protein